MLAAGDIGGTKTQLAIFDSSEIIYTKKYFNKNFPDFYSLFQTFLKDCPHRVTRVGLGIAGPIKNNQCKMSNLNWTIKKDQLIKETCIENFCLLNDLEAYAYGLQTLKEEDLFFISKNTKREEGHIGLVASGTGLGVAQLFWDGKKHNPIPTEAGHGDFSPKSEKEVHLLTFLYKNYGRAYYDQILSGDGLYHLYEFLNEFNHTPLSEEQKKNIEKENAAQFIVEEAFNEKKEVAIETLNFFIEILGSKAGDLALHLLPKGGIYLGGGVTRKLKPLFKQSQFTKYFTSKGKMTELLNSTPVALILKETTPLEGAALFANEYFEKD